MKQSLTSRHNYITRVQQASAGSASVGLRSWKATWLAAPNAHDHGPSPPHTQHTSSFLLPTTIIANIKSCQKEASTPLFSLYRWTSSRESIALWPALQMVGEARGGSTRQDGTD